MTRKELLLLLREYMREVMSRMEGESSRAKALAAIWRHEAGREPGENPELYGDFLLDFPDKLQGEGGELTPYMRAAWMALTMYVLGGKCHKQDVSLGKAAYECDSKIGKDSSSTKKRLLVVETTSKLEKLDEPLRAVIHMLNSKGIYLDYAQLAVDLANWPKYRLSVVRRWEKDYALKRAKLDAD